VGKGIFFRVFGAIHRFTQTMSEPQPFPSRSLPVNALTLMAAGTVAMTAVGLAGWGLSLIGALSRVGYLVAAGLAGGVLVIFWKRWGLNLQGRIRRSRWRRPLPLVWLTGWLLAAGGAVLHPPNNIDAVTYRLPRVLHWLAAGHWHWIDTVDPRQNYSGTLQEWLFAPGLAVLGTDRWLGLINIGLAAALPGLLFVVMRGLGVAGAVAGRWMWLLPLAPVYLLQAGSIANDLPGGVAFVAALAFALRARFQGGAGWLAVSLLAMALATNAKTSNLPLVLPWLLLIAPAAWRAWADRRRVWLVVLPVAVLGSIAPTLLLNHMHTGAWSGDPADVLEVRGGDPVIGLVGNGVQGALQNLSPPVLPGAERAERLLVERMGASRLAVVRSQFPRFSLHLTELAQEEWSGLGGLMVVLLLAGGWGRGRAPSRLKWIPFCVVLPGTVLATLMFGALLGSEMTARLLAPYYPLLVIAVLVLPGQARWVRTRGFRVLAAITIGGSLVPLVMAPARPLLPVSALLKLAAPIEQFTPGVTARARVLYAVYRDRHDALATVVAPIPAEVTRVGVLASRDDSELSLWRPFGGRRVVTVRSGDTVAALRAKGVEWIVVRADVLGEEEVRRTWLRAHAAEVVVERLIPTKARHDSETWWLVRLRGQSGPESN